MLLLKLFVAFYKCEQIVRKVYKVITILTDFKLFNIGNFLGVSRLNVCVVSNNIIEVYNCNVK